MSTKHKIYVNGFWPGFLEKTDANHIDFFERIFRSTRLGDFQFTQNLNDATVLFESVFNTSLVNAKPWLYKIHYSGEPQPKVFPAENYDLVLFSEQDHKNIVDLPLFAYYIHGNDLLNKIIHRQNRTGVPSKFCCFIVSNGNCHVRNKMFEMLNRYKKVDSCGNYANNMGAVLKHDYWTDEFRRFISDYKFVICFENSKFGTYSTEKIVNPYLANVVPIYWSSHHIKKIFNPDSMLFLEDERYEQSYTHLIDRIIELDNNDAKYLEFVNRPAILIREDESSPFSSLNNNVDDLRSPGLAPVSWSAFWKENYTIDAISRKIDNVLFSNKKIFVTHYRPLVERRASIIQQFEREGVRKFEFIECKDREELTKSDTQKFQGIKPSEISLFLKHMDIFRKDISGEIVVVLEDDAILCDRFLEKIDKYVAELDAEDPDWDILFSGECCGLHVNTKPGKHVYLDSRSRGTCMYILNRGVGKKLCAIFDSQPIIQCAIDWWFINIHSSSGLSYYWSEPALVQQGSEIGAFKSAIR